MSEGKITTRVSLRWRDIDVLGHLNQSVYHEFLEEGRTALIERIAEDAPVGEKGAWVLARVELDHRSEVRREDGEVDIVVWIDRVGTKSLTMANEVRKLDGTVCASGKTVVLGWDAEARKARELSQAEKAWLEASAPGGDVAP